MVAFLDRFPPKTAKSKNEFVAINIAGPTTLPLFLPKTSISGQEVLQIIANINNPISA